MIEWQKKTKKLSTNYGKAKHKVIEKKGSSVTIESEEGVQKSRNIIHLKKVHGNRCDMDRITDENVEETGKDIRGVKGVNNDSGKVERPKRSTHAPSRFKDFIT